MKSQKGICKPCKTVLEETSKVPKRIEVLDNKYKDLKPMLDKFETDDRAFMYLEHFFKPRQKKLLEILVERYYHQDRTLDEIGKKRGVTREYIRQCENKAIEILKKAMSFDDMDEKKIEDLI
jgi:DNA-directed RNA polymerase sigma subunit (sigma70/sigma32)